MESTLQKYLTMLESIGEYFFISLLLGISVTLLVESWRKNLRYLLAAVIFGTMVGYGVQYVPSWEQFSTLATVAATITGPATIAALQRKSLIDVGKDLQEVAERMTNKGRSSSYGSSYPKNVPSDDARRTLPSGGDPYG